MRGCSKDSDASFQMVSMKTTQPHGKMLVTKKSPERQRAQPKVVSAFSFGNQAKISAWVPSQNGEGRKEGEDEGGGMWANQLFSLPSILQRL